ncbi:sn-1,2-diacylglycerol cholinephosphotransferas-like protein [Lophium mytilinum]|uniref:diacylglycerol cholinephosphotransferase n=1 Tax=Lophium mytilinum TaxID=390894 RepID=A0A6A6RH77_9PEZI|nr:sn-1,2-diacylglycerol cholinephosphotransferas-like protein [Lophium mytilinum]
MVYIRQDKLPRLKEYKYSGVDHSPVSKYIMKPFYNNVVIKCFPKSMAPNLITLTGFSFVIANFLTLLWYTPGLDQDCPPWVYASWSIGLFLYQTFDAVDGTQARRTGQSGPLGELFDHGVDALNTTLECLIFSACMNLGQGWKSMLVLFGSSLTFYVQTWDEYHTHTLTLGVISGPVEGLLILCTVYGFTAFVGGGSFWQQSLFETVGIPHLSIIPDYIYNLAWDEWYMVQGGSVLVFNTISSAQNVMKARRERGQQARVALLGLAPFFTVWTLVPIYLKLQPEILHHHLVPFIFFVGLINAYSVGRMIISHLTKSRFPRGNVLIFPLAYGVIDSLGPFLQQNVGFGWPSALGDGTYQVAFVFLCLGLGIGVHGSFVVDVIFAICDYLDIWCLTIKYPQGKEQAEKKGK